MNWETWFNVCNPLETLNLLLFLNSASGIDRLRKGTLSYPLVEWNRNTTVNKKIELKSWWLLLAGRPLGSYFLMFSALNDRVVLLAWNLSACQAERVGTDRSLKLSSNTKVRITCTFIHRTTAPESSGLQIFEPVFKREIWNGTEIVRVIDYQRTSWPIPSLNM